MIILLFSVSIFASAYDWESYQIIDRLLTLPGPSAPVVFEDNIIFTAASTNRRAGVAFAHENFARVHWFRQLLLPQDPIGAPIPPGRRVPDPYKDSGILFHILQVPEDLNEIEYRLIINGLWTTDPANPQTRRDPVSGLTLSVLSIPSRRPVHNLFDGPPGTVNFSFRAPPGEIITVAGTFNSWDPFMFQLIEGPPGVYTLSLPLPPGRHQYMFFRQGRRYLDPNNHNRAYSIDGRAVSEVIVR